MLNPPEVVQGPGQGVRGFVERAIEFAGVHERGRGSFALAAPVVQLARIPVQGREARKPGQRGQQHLGRPLVRCRLGSHEKGPVDAWCGRGPY